MTSMNFNYCEKHVKNDMIIIMEKLTLTPWYNYGYKHKRDRWMSDYTLDV